MADEQKQKSNVIEFDPNDAAKVKLLVSQIKTLLEVKAKDFAQQYIAKQDNCPEYLIDEDFGVVLIEKALGKCFDTEEWDNDELLSIASNAFALVVIDHIADYYEPDTVDEG